MLLLYTTLFNVNQNRSILRKCILLVSCMIVFLLSFNSFEAKASHAAGGELLYEWVSDSTYRFYFKFYRDCSGVNRPFNATLCWQNPCASTSGSENMPVMTLLPGGGANGQQVSTGCANQKSRCDSAGSNIPGYEEWWYSTTFTLPSACTNWTFSVTIAARNASDNLSGSFNNFYVESILNSVAAPGNSSPVFSVKPVPYVCINQDFQYNNGGIDPDNDSLTFEVVRPQQKSTSCAASPTLVAFASGSPAYSIPTNPFQTNNTFVIDTLTGELEFTPSLAGSHTVTVRANEYRNGVFIGSVMRDIQVQVITCIGGNSVKPTVTVDQTSISGAATYSNDRVEGCATKQFSFCYDIISTDTSAKLVASDNHNASAPGSSVNYTGFLNDTIRGCITWTPGATDTGTRVLVVSVKDSSCSSGGIPITYTFTVPLYVWASTVAIKDTTICAGESVPLTGVGGSAYIWSVIPGGSPLSSLSCTICKSPIASPAVTTSYVLTSNSAAVCNQNLDTVTVTVVQPPSSFPSSNAPICVGDTLKLFGNSVTGASYSWTGPNSFTSSIQNPTILNAQTANAGFYSLTVTGNTGCASPTSFLSVYVGPPPAPTPTSNSPVCLNSTLNLMASTIAGTNVTYNWSGPNGFTAPTQNPSRMNMTFADTGYYVVYAVRDGCTTFSDSVHVSVNDLPSPPTPTTPVTYCQSVTANALQATGSNLLWYTMPTGGTGLTTLIPSTASAGTFKYYVSQTDGNGCESLRDSVTVNILPKPAQPVANNPNQTYCQGETIPQLSATGTNLLWYTVPTGGTGSSTAFTPSSSTPGVTTFYVSQTGANGCESDRDTITVTVLALPAGPTVNSPVDYCEGSTPGQPLSNFVTGTNILWYDDPTGGAGTTTVPTVNTSVPGSDTFYVSQTVNGCEGTSRSMLIVNIIAKPAPPQTSDTLYCQFFTASPLSANVIGTNLLWYNAPTGGTGSATAPTPSTTVQGTFTFYVSQTVNGCESERDSVKVTVITKPDPPVATDTAICQFSFAGQLQATGSNLRWWDTAIGGIQIIPTPTPSTADTGKFYWYVSQIVGGCESDRDTLELTVKPRPEQPETDSVEYCLNAPAMQLTAVGSNLIWYNLPFGGTGSTVAPTPTTTTVGYTRYYVSQTVNGCESIRDTIVVKVDTTVTARILVDTNQFCLYDSLKVEYQGVIPDTGTFTWTWTGANIIEGDTSGPYIVNWDTAGVKTITVFAQAADCKARDTIMVEALPVPEVYFDLGVSEICVGKDLTISVDSILNDVNKFNWLYDSSDITIVSADSNSITTKWTTLGQKVISLYTTSDSGCISNTISDTLTVEPFPAAKILDQELRSNTICRNTEITLKAETLVGLHTYEWSPQSYFLNNRSGEVVAKIPSSGYLMLKVTDQLGCEGYDSVYVDVKICCDIFMPNAFTPNGDGKNDVFRIVSSAEQQVYAFRIVNRYGQTVFYTENPSQGWDGTVKGTPQDIGTYYYYIKYACREVDRGNELEKTGNVILMR